MKPLVIELIAVGDLVPYARNARLHDEVQVSQIAASIKEFGFTNPILIDAAGGIIAGHGRVLAARRIRLKEVPCIRLAHLTSEQRRALVLADNKIALNSRWDEELLRAELESIQEIDLTELGFDDEDLSELDSAKTGSGVREIDVGTVDDQFWISVRGPLKHQAQALCRLRGVMDELPLEVELGTTPRELE